MFDSLIISLLDSDAQKGLFKKELAEKLDIPLICLGEIWIESVVNNGVVHQYLYVQFFDEIYKKNLMKLDFAFIEDSCIVFEVGDTIL